MDKDAYYFPHFSNARHDRKLRRLRKELEVEGYGIYFMVLEVLRDQDGFSYPMEDIDLLADEFGTTEQKVRVVICNYGLFEVNENEFFYSPKFIEYLKPYLEVKERNRINGIKGNLIKYNYATKEQINQMSREEILALNENKPDLVGGDSGGESQGDRYKRKEKEIKEKEIKLNQNKNLVSTDVTDVPNASDSLTWDSANRVAEYLLKAICESDPTHKYTRNKPSLNGWVKDIDKAIRLDGRTEDQLMFLIEAVFRDCHKYSELWSKWHQNIQSGSKLRDQFDTIKNQIKDSKDGTNKKRTKGDDDYAYLSR